MKRFWDRRATENPFYFIDNRLGYRDSDVERFWREGRDDLDGMLAVLDLAIRPSDRVVEVGCGIGRLTRVIAERAAGVQALDVSGRMLELAREHNPRLHNVEWLVGDGASLTGVPACSADACISLVVFQHIPDPVITLGYVREFGRVLRPEGWAAFQISNDPGIHRPRRNRTRIRQIVASLLGRAPRGQGNEAWLGAAVDLDDLRRVADEEGMDVERVVGEGRQFCYVRLRRRALRDSVSTA